MWINNDTHLEVCDEITYPFPNLVVQLLEVWEWIKNFLGMIQGSGTTSSSWSCHCCSTAWAAYGRTGNCKDKMPSSLKSSCILGTPIDLLAHLLQLVNSSSLSFLLQWPPSCRWPCQVGWPSFARQLSPTGMCLALTFWPVRLVSSQTWDNLWDSKPG